VRGFPAGVAHISGRVVAEEQTGPSTESESPPPSLKGNENTRLSGLLKAIP